MTDDERRQRIVIGTGIDLDKRELYELNKAITRDRDLRKLSLLGPVLWNFFVLGLVVGTAVILVSQLSTLVSVSFSVIDSLTSLGMDQLYEAGTFILKNGLLMGVVLYAFSILWRNLQSRLRESFIEDFVTSVKRFPKQIGKSLVVLNLGTWQNHNYWHSFTSGQSDRDPLVILSNMDGEGAVSGIFSDIPYYRNVFVDSVYVGFEGLGRWHSLQLRWFDRGLRLLRASALVVLSIPAALFVVHTRLVSFGSVPVLGDRWLTLGQRATHSKNHDTHQR